MLEEKSYRQIFKAMSLFGGVQILVIFFGIIRNKAIATSMGPAGVGEMGLYNTAMTLIVAVTSLGIGSSAIKMISETYNNKNFAEFEKNVLIFNKLSIYTGLSGAILTIILSPFLSWCTFGSYNYTISFIFLSTIVFFLAVDTKQLVLLQGIRSLKDEGKSSVFGALAGTVISVPLYIYFKGKAIVPSLIIIFFCNMVSSYYFARKIKIPKQHITFDELKERGKSFISLGLAMTASYILVYAVSYIVRLYISQKGGVQQVGLYQAGWAIVNGYVGLIFIAMAKDYYPRLASANMDNDQMCKMANQQMELGLLVISPIIVVFLVLMNKIVSVLYSSEFYNIKHMMIWSLLGMFFKLLSWSISYVFLAKGLAKKFVVYETTINIVTVVLNILFYKYLELEGLGFAFYLVNFIYLIIVFYMARSSFNFTFSRSLKWLFLFNVIICTTLGLLLRFANCVSQAVFYILFAVGLLLISICSIIELNKKLNIKKIFFNQ